MQKNGKKKAQKPCPPRPADDLPEVHLVKLGQWERLLDAVEEAYVHAESCCECFMDGIDTDSVLNGLDQIIGTILCCRPRRPLKYSH